MSGHGVEQFLRDSLGPGISSRTRYPGRTHQKS
jgi:hypothetical protein